MPRRDYEDDPSAPKANSLVPAASVVVVDDGGRVLLQRRTDNGMWALPGGRMDVGESIGDCGIRETYEETGIHIEITGIVGTYTNPGHILAYDDGESGRSSASASSVVRSAASCGYPTSPTRWPGSPRRRRTSCRWCPASASG